MANNTDIVKEIEEAERVLTRNYKAHKARWYAGTSLNFNQAETIIKTLQRARDALRWIPVSELPIDGIPVVVQCFADDLETKIYFLCERGVNFRGEPDWFDVHTGQPIEFEPRQWKYVDTAYTPEEK